MEYPFYLAPDGPMPHPLNHDGPHVCDVPREVDVCPECGDALYVESSAWDERTGQPLRSGITLSCEAEEKDVMEWEQSESKVPFREVCHRWYQCDWQPVVDRVCEWIRQNGGLIDE